MTPARRRSARAKPAAVTVEVDGAVLEATADETLMQVLDRTGRLGEAPLVPSLCWHPALGASGSCQLCRVEVEATEGAEGGDEGGPALLAACTLPVREGMVIRTDGPRVRAAREQVLGLALARHALECSICDASGECGLQQAVFRHGPLHARRRETPAMQPERVSLGAGLVLERGRCVLCERCVRFCDEVTGTGELVFTGHGDTLAVACAEDRVLDNAYAQNLPDLCPVGAITRSDARPRHRPWTLVSTASVCGGCARGCNVWVDTAGDQVVRYRPRRNDAVNRTWLCDAGRLGAAGAERVDRLRTAALRDERGRLVEVSIEDAIEEAAGRIGELVDGKGAGVLAGLASAHATNEDLFAFRRFLDVMGTEHAGVVAPVGEGDDHLILPEKAANLHGAEALGFGSPAGLLDRLRGGGLDALVVMGHDVLTLPDADDPALFDRVDTLILVDTTPSPLVRRAHVVIPARHLLEKRGTVTSGDGRVQRVEPAREPGFPALAEGDFVTRLARCLGVDGFDAPWDPHAVSRAVGDAFPAFVDRDWDAVGAAGLPLAKRARGTTRGTKKRGGR